MQWLNINTKTLDSPEIVGADPVERGTWLMLLRFCVGQENGGRIEECRNWKCRKWQQLVRVTAAEVATPSELWRWDGDALEVEFYPLDKEAQVKRLAALGKTSSPAKVRAAKNNGAKGGRPGGQVKNPTGTQQETQQETEQKTHGKPIERKGKERKGIERESAREAQKPKVGLDFHDPGNVSGFENLALRIVGAYPRREKTAEALKIVLDQLEDGADPEAMLAGTRESAKVISALPSGALNRYVPSAVEFFRAKRWADDPATLNRQGGPNGQAPMTTADVQAQLGGRSIYVPSTQAP